MNKKKTTLAPAFGNSPEKALLEKAEEHSKKSEYVAAEKLANEVLALANGNNTLSLEDKAQALCILGTSCIYTARFDEALIHFGNAFAISEIASNLLLQSRALIGSAEVQMKVGAYDVAMGVAATGLALAETVGDERQKLDGLTIIGRVHFRQGTYKVALEYLERALTTAQKIGRNESTADLLCDIGMVYSDLSEAPRALEFYSRALALMEGTANSVKTAKIFGNIGNTFRYLSEFNRALDYYSRALTIYESIGYLYGESISYGNIGLIYYMLEDFPQALSYYSRALSMCEKIGDQSGIASNLGNIGLVYTDTQEYSIALDFFSRAMEISTKIGAAKAICYWMHGQAIVQYKLGNLDVAYQGLLESLRLKRDILGIRQGLVFDMLYLGKILIDQGRVDEALLQFEEALALALQTGEKQRSCEAEEEMSIAFMMMGDTAKAYEHLTKHNAIEKEIHTEELKKRMDNFNMRVAISEIEHGVEVQKLRIEHMEHDLANSAIQLSAQTDLLDHFRNDLRQIFGEMDEPIAAMKRIKEKLKALPCESIDWPKFEAQFIAVHPDFKAKLEEKYPALTPQEVRMCSLVRVGLRNPEIAKLLCLSERTLENHRFNIRKKFSIKTEQSLHDFLSKSI